MKKIVILLISTLLFVVNFTFNENIVYADNHNLLVYLSKFEETDDYAKIKAWKISNNAKEEYDEKKLSAELYNLSESELTSKYGTSIEPTELTSDGIAKFININEGIYYVRQTENKNENWELAPFIVRVSGEKTVVQAKKYIPKEKYGKRKFVKTSTTTAVLAGAEFVVYCSKDGEKIPVIINNEHYKVISDINGNFEVKDLEFGEYFLKEVKAPTGYKLENNYIPFIISPYSTEEETITVINYPNTPPLIEIPYTGNATLIIVSSIGLLLFILGVSLVISEKVTKNKK